MLHLLNLSLFMALFWLALSGHYTPLLLAFGALSVGLVVWLAHRMDVVDHESVPVHLSRRAVTFWPWLVVEIVKSNIDVIRRVLDPKLPIQRSVIRVPTGEMSPLRETIYANAITLTPGTVSLDVGDGEVVVHALSRVAAEAVREGEMARRVTSMERTD
ncbi:MAG: Na+/H+ antiporter subunit E [Gammaproteobacteria bacterium]|nr:Na+/H+ antiporter subunit E [Gammaproteobacteria bacterium]